MDVIKFKPIYFVIITVILIQQSSLSCFGQKIRYQRIEIPFDKEILTQVQSLGIPVDFINRKQMMVFEISELEAKLLKNSKISYNVVIDDLEKYYRERNSGKNPAEILLQQRQSKGYTIPDGFELGSMGGCCKLDEMLTHLDFMAENYPELISPRLPAGDLSTIEQRQVYWVKISDNPLINENEPEVLYTALTHSREPVSMQQMLFFMYYLLENYSTDSLIKSLVDNTELYFIPCVNPDGYVYNEVTNPQGGGMWRKNRRLVATNVYGVDLNRNFGYQWGYDNYGSSSIPSSSTYRGPSAFSERETSIIRNFCAEHEFSISLNFHTNGQYLLHPWGYVSYIYPPDYQIMQEWAKLITNENHYRYGNSASLLYLVNGDINDYLYGEVNEKPQCFGFTPEVGNADDGFWPPIEEIVPQCFECLHMNLTVAQLAGYHFTLTNNTPVTISGHEDYINFQIQRNGLRNAPVTVSVEPVSGNFESAGTPRSYELSNILGAVTDSIQIFLGPGIKPGDTISFVLKATCEYFATSQVCSHLFGTTNAVFSDDCNTIEKWISSDWTTTGNQFFSPAASVISTSGSYYPNNKISQIRMAQSTDLSETNNAWLQFYARWELDGGQDFVRCVASTNGGQSWQTLPGNYTCYNFITNLPDIPVYAGKQTSWIKETIDLSRFAGENILLGFYFHSDESIGKPGFFFDDVKVETLSYQPEIQEISISKGWSGLSAYLVPENSNLNQLFANQSSNLEIIVHNNLFFQPGNSQSTLTHWNSSDGYKVKFLQNTTLQLSGFPESVPFLQLSEGWNLVPVLKQNPVSVYEISTSPPEKITLIRDVVGQTVYWPDEQIGTLIFLIPGKSYFIKASGSCKLYYE